MIGLENMRKTKLLPRKRRMKKNKVSGCIECLYNWEHDIHLSVGNEEELKGVVYSKKDGDLLSNCCAWDFDAFGYEKEEGIYQERCLKCGKLCEPLWIGSNDIENIRSCYFWNKLNEPNL